MTKTTHDKYQAVKATVEMFNLAAALLDRDAGFIYRNSRFKAKFYNPSDKVSTYCLRDLLTDPDKTRLDTFFANADASIASFKCNVAHQSETYELTVAPLLVDGVATTFLCQISPSRAAADVKLRYLMDHLDQGVWDYDTRTDIFVVSDEWRRIRGMAPDADPIPPGTNWLDRIHPDDRTSLQKVFEGQTRGETESINIQYRHIHTQGHWVWILCHARVVARDADGLPIRIVGTDTDVTQSRKTEEDMAQLAEKLRLAVDAAGIGVWEFNPNSGKVHWDDRMLAMYGLTDGQNDRPGEAWQSHLHPDDRDDMVAYSEHCQENGLDFSRDYRIVTSGGALRHIRSRASQVKVPGGQPKLVGVNIDVTEDYCRAKELEQAKARLHHESRHDALTGLANRRLLDETTASLNNHDAHRSYAVLHLDLDYFKTINDTLGHAAGDAVLVKVGQTLKKIIDDRGLVCRIGGDEFAVFFATAPNTRQLHSICNELINALKEPIMYQGHPCKIGVSIGCAFGIGPSDNHADLFKRADAALYEAKSAGRNCYRVGA